jgi:ATP-binding cassette subfamily F protein 2
VDIDNRHFPPAGKSTLLKLMIGELEPSEGVVGRHSHMTIGRYHQHSTEILDPNKTVLEFFMVRFAVLLDQS